VAITVAGKKPALAQARPLEFVPQVDPARHTADMLYELPAPPSGVLAKDQLVDVWLPLGELREETVVSDAAVIFDAFGGAWVYLDRTEPGADRHVYGRQRVELGPPLEEGSVIRPPLRAGDRVVSSGAAELFSREFHRPPASKAEPIDDD
jgi:hypothetical protein